MAELFLIGGGWDDSSFEDTFGRFVRAGRKDGRCKILLLLAVKDPAGREEVTADFRHMFESMGNVEVEPFFLSRTNQLTQDVLEAIDPTCVFVGGGLTPWYEELLASNREFIDHIVERDLPYGGFSAGAAIAARQSVVGGWKVRGQDRDVPILDEDFSEDLEYIEVREGLGLIDFPIDVHGSHWGTLTRMLHAVERGMVEKGLVIDESTMIECSGGALTVFGNGQVYRVQKKGQSLEVAIFKHGEQIS